MNGLADMMSGPQLDGPESGSMGIAQDEETQEEDPGNMEAFRKTLIRQSRSVLVSRRHVFHEKRAFGTGDTSWRRTLVLLLRPDDIW